MSIISDLGSTLFKSAPTGGLPVLNARAEVERVIAERNDVDLAPNQRADMVDLSASIQAARRLVGGRLSVDMAAPWLSSINGFIAPPDADCDWRVFQLDANSLQLLRPHKLMEILIDLSPDVSRAYWDLQRLFNPGWTLKVVRGTGDTPYVAGQRAVEDMIATLNENYGTVDQVFSRIFSGIFLRGAVFCELVLDPDGLRVVDLVTPDPISVRFKWVEDPVRGRVAMPGQWYMGTFFFLDRPTVVYIPVDPITGSPYGRPLASPALFSTLFLLGLLHDLRRVVAQQGYPRIDISINVEAMLASLPESISANPALFREWVNSTIDEVIDAYSKLKPDDAYVHTSAVEVNRNVGTVDAHSLGAIQPLIEALERMAVRALKTVPLLMGTTGGTSEANANRQWEVQAAAVKALQHLGETALERLFGLGLQAQGLQGRVVFRFAELRAAEAMRDAQTRMLEIQNEFNLWAYGLQSMDELADHLVGHPPVATEPILIPNASVPLQAAQGNAGAENPDPGSARDIELAARNYIGAAMRPLRSRQPIR